MIKVSKIEKRYRDVVALQECNLEFAERGLVCLTGESGSGKTTFLNIVGMLDSPTSGNVLYNGESLDTERKKSDYRRNNVSFVFQDAVMFEQLNVKENILASLKVNGLEYDEKFFYETVEQLKIRELLDRKVNELSAGQKQRIVIARSLMKKPQILLADEPTGNLDEENTENVFEVLKSISKNILVIVVTHNENVAKKYANRLIKINYGKIVRDEKLENENIGQASYTSRADGIKITKKKLMFYSFANMRKNYKKYRKIIPVCVLSMILVALGFSFIKTSNANTSNVQKYFLETNLISVEENCSSNVTAALVCELSQKKFISDYKFLEMNEDIEQITPNYSLIGYDIKGKQSTRFKEYVGIEIDKYYKEKFAVSDIAGEFIRNDNEIILSSALVKVIFPDDNVNECLGKTVTLEGTYYNEDFQIVGINYSEDVTGVIKSYITVDALKRLADNEAEGNTVAYLYTDKSYYVEQMFGEQYINIEHSGQAEVISKNDISDGDILFGRMIENDDEIMISEGFVETFAALFQDGEFVQITKGIADNIFDTEMLCVMSGYGHFKVVGIYTDNSNGLSCVISDEAIRGLREAIPTSINVYANESKIEEVITYIAAYDLQATMPYYHFKEAVGDRMSSATMLFFILIVVLLVAVTMMINTFSKNLIVDCTRDIGLFKALGANKGDIAKIYIYEFGMVGLCCAVLSIILYPAITYVINYCFEKGYINVMTSAISIDIVFLVGILLIGIIVFIVSCIPSVIKSTKIDAIVAIRKIC